MSKQTIYLADHRLTFSIKGDKVDLFIENTSNTYVNYTKLRFKTQDLINLKEKIEQLLIQEL